MKPAQRGNRADRVRRDRAGIHRPARPREQRSGGGKLTPEQPNRVQMTFLASDASVEDCQRIGEEIEQVPQRQTCFLRGFPVQDGK